MTLHSQAFILKQFSKNINRNSLRAVIIDREAWRTLDQTHCSELLSTAEEAARAAGAVIIAHLGCSNGEECEVKTNLKDVVTMYDKEAQFAVEQIVREKYPDHSFLGEEDVDPGADASVQALANTLKSAKSGYLWIVDPIDGTANFASGLALCAVTMGVIYQGTPIVGVVYDPHRDEMFSAVRGKGATLNSHPLSTQSIDDISDAIINAGCPADNNAFVTSMRGMAALNGQARGIRMIACSALTLSWIAAGRLSAHFGYDLSSWDLVAGALLIQEAGGTVTDLDGSEYLLETRNMLCSNGPIHDQVLKILRDADAVSFTRSS